MAAGRSQAGIMSFVAPPDRFDRRRTAKSFCLDDALQAGHDFAKNLSPQNVRLLDGGFSNANFLVTSGNKSGVVRFYPDGEAIARREVAILRLAQKNGVRVPNVLHDVQTVGGQTSVILEFIPGPSVSRVTSSFKEIGRQLGLIHGIPFEKSGWIGSTGTVENPFGDFQSEAHKYIVTPLAGRAGRRLGTNLTERLRYFVEAHWPIVQDTFSQAVLIHCDFNPKNLIVGPITNQVTVLDWEFAIAGHPLCDLGNFFRFEEDYEPQMKAEFLSGYESVRGSLPPRWREAARLLDLVSMCTFLDSEEDLPKTFRTARMVIEKTLAAME